MGRSVGVELGGEDFSLGLGRKLGNVCMCEGMSPHWNTIMDSDKVYLTDFYILTYYGNEWHGIDLGDLALNAAINSYSYSMERSCWGKLSSPSTFRMTDDLGIPLGPGFTTDMHILLYPLIICRT